jgi:mannose/fructose/N-acetylgalactosamine-specific phosphotransferase system component IID
MARMHWNQIWRIFLIQSSRNERTLDGLGFFHVVAPLIPSWGRSKGDRKAAAKRHAGYFNANPLVASYVAGVVVNLEGRRSRGEEISPERIDRVKSALSSVLTARGDSFFEQILIPLALTIASISAINSSYIGLVIFLVLYNVYHFQSRIGGYLRGVELGEGVGGGLVARLFREERFLGGCAAFVAGMFAALALAGARGAGGTQFLIAGTVLAGLGVGLRRKVSHAWSVVILFCGAALFLVLRGYIARAIP